MEIKRTKNRNATQDNCKSRDGVVGRNKTFIGWFLKPITKVIHLHS